MKKENQSKQSSQTNIEKEKFCPFDETLKCENCRLYQPVWSEDAKGKKYCVFVTMAARI